MNTQQYYFNSRGKLSQIILYTFEEQIDPIPLTQEAKELIKIIESSEKIAFGSNENELKKIKRLERIERKNAIKQGWKR